MALARELFDREMNGGYGTFDDAVMIYADVLGEAGLAEYRRLAAESWAKLPPRAGETRAREEVVGDYSQLMRIIDFFAERDGDVEARIALRVRDLSSPWSYLQLAEFCSTQGRNEQAVRVAEEGLWVFEDGRPDERLLFFAVDLLTKAGRKGDAEAHLWRAFEKAPSLSVYERLRKLGGKAARERAVSFLETQLAKQKPSGWGLRADLLVHVLMQERMFDAGWAAVRKHGASVGVKAALARASEASHPADSLAVYAERVDQLAGAGGNHAYAEAAELVTRMAGLRTAAEQIAYVAALKTRHGRKRNLMKLLG